jgi:hypothetical protein
MGIKSPQTPRPPIPPSNGVAGLPLCSENSGSGWRGQPTSLDHPSHLLI